MLFDGLVAVLNADSSAGVDGSSSLNVRVGVDGGRVGTNASSRDGNGGGSVKTRVGKGSTVKTSIAKTGVTVRRTKDLGLSNHGNSQQNNLKKMRK